MANDVVIHVKAKDDASKTMHSIGASAKSLAVGAGVAALAVGAVLVRAMGKASIAARETAKVHAQTVAVLKSTSGAANVTAKGVEKLATAISNKTGIDDEAIQSGENLLLTFTNIRNEVGKGNDIFNQATATITDMSVALGQDMKSSAIQVGKALNDPIKGMTALRRVGVSFTKSQEDQVKKLVKTGHVLEAQKLILHELKKEFGGSAEAAATWADKAKVAAGNIEESFGTLVNKGLEPVAKWFVQTGGPAIQEFFDKVGKNKELKRGLKELGHTLEDIGATDMSGLFDSLNNDLPEAVRNVNKAARTFGKLHDATKVGPLGAEGDRNLQRWKTRTLRAMDAVASAGAKKSGLVPQKFADAIHDARVKSEKELKKTQKRYEETKAAIEKKHILATLKADNRDAQKKYRETKKALNDKDLTKDRKAKLKAENKQAQDKITETTHALDRLNGKTAKTYIKVYTTKEISSSTNTGGRATGGITSAATGGARGNQVLVGEQGPEIVDLPLGSHVNSNADSRRIAGSGGRGGRGGVTININAPGVTDTNGLRRMLVDMHRRGELDVVLR